MPGPLAGNEGNYITPLHKNLVETLAVKSRGHIITPGRMFMSAHKRCRDNWRCTGPGCVIRRH